MPTVVRGISVEHGKAHRAVGLGKRGDLLCLEWVMLGRLQREVMLELSLAGYIGVSQAEERLRLVVPGREKPEIRQCFYRTHRVHRGK